MISNDILKLFIPIEDMNSFLAFDNIIYREEKIIIFYRAPLFEKITIKYSDYKNMEKKINRSKKLTELI